MTRFLTTTAAATALAVALPMNAEAFVTAADFTHAFTEGTRANNDGEIMDSTVLTDVPSNPNNAQLLPSLNAGQNIGIFGRVVGALDSYSLEIDAASDFTVSFVFGGYKQQDGTIVNDSGLVSENPSPEKNVGFKLTNTDDNSMQTTSFITDVTSGNPVIFTALAGNYVLTIDGTVGDTDGLAALYDLEIQAVPLPAPLALLLAGVVGLGFAGYRKSRAEA